MLFKLSALLCTFFIRISFFEAPFRYISRALVCFIGTYLNRRARNIGFGWWRLFICHSMIGSSTFIFIVYAVYALIRLLNIRKGFKRYYFILYWLLMKCWSLAFLLNRWFILIWTLFFRKFLFHSCFVFLCETLPPYHIVNIDKGYLVDLVCGEV